MQLRQQQFCEQVQVPAGVTKNVEIGFVADRI
jgi:hypothetical protein